MYKAFLISLLLLLLGFHAFTQKRETILREIEFGRRAFEQSQKNTEYRAIITFNLAVNYSKLDNTDSFFYFLIDCLNDQSSIEHISSTLGDCFFIKYHESSRWQKIDSFYTKSYFLWSKSPNKDYAYALLRMYGMEQGVRYYFLYSKEEGDLIRKEIQKVDKANRNRLKQLIQEYGFPIKSRVGEYASEKSFLLMQHADADIEFQKQCLDSMEYYITQDEYQKKDYAYLKDRIMLKETGKQLYGTQIKDLKNREFYPIIDSANVDKRREEMGLNTLEQYLNSIVSF